MKRVLNMRKILGIDIGHHQLKMVMMNGDVVTGTIVEPVPESFIKDGKIVSVDEMGVWLRKIVRTNKISYKNAAVILPQDSYYLRTINMPVMSKEQLLYNIPFEFHDYITDDISNYLFDYAIQGDSSSLAEDEEMTVMTAAISKSVLEDWRFMLRKAGLNLAIAAPGICGIAAAIRSRHMDKQEKEFGIIDIGYSTICFHFFKGDEYKGTRENEHGISEIVDIVSGALQIDQETAISYIMSDQDKCTSLGACEAAFSAISIDLMRAINFYRFSNPDCVFEDVWVCGGGSMIKSLMDEIRNTLNLNVHMASELMNTENAAEDTDIFFLASAIAMIESENA